MICLLSVPIILWYAYCLFLWFYGMLAVCSYNSKICLLTVPISLWYAYCLFLWFYGMPTVCSYDSATGLLSFRMYDACRLSVSVLSSDEWQNGKVGGHYSSTGSLVFSHPYQGKYCTLSFPMCVWACRFRIDTAYWILCSSVSICVCIMFAYFLLAVFFLWPR